jgi:hypothetical protein
LVDFCDKTIKNMASINCCSSIVSKIVIKK